MILSLMLCSLFVSAVIMLAATVLHAQERAANRPVRWIWSAAIALAVVLTAALPLRNAERVDATRFTARAGVLQPSEATPRAMDPFTRVSLAVRDVVDATSASLGQIVRAANDVSPTLQRTALALWAAATIGAVLLLLSVYRRIHRKADSWQREELHGATVRVSENAGPAVVGIRPMEVVVPAWILARPEAEQRLVLSHEHEHIRARDPLLLLGACTAVALMPWNPLLWYALSRLRLAVEIDCDRRVLQRGIAPLAYGRLLLDLSQHPSSLAGSLPALAYSTSHLERRLLAMTSRPARFIVARRVSGGIIAAAALLAACESKLPTSAEIENMDAASAVQKVAVLPGIDTTRTVYVLDGKTVSGDEARTISGSRLASIAVLKKDGSTSEIRMRTRSADSSIVINEMSPVRQAEGIAKFRVRSDSAALLPTRQSTVRSKSGFSGLFVIDGTLVSSEAANSLQPDRISSVEVIKGAAATKLYSDPRAVNGVILITTKK